MTAVTTTAAVITSPRGDVCLLSQLSSFPATRLHITWQHGSNCVRNRCAVGYSGQGRCDGGHTGGQTTKARCNPGLSCSLIVVRDTGIEPVTSSVSGKRSPAELIAPGTSWRWRRESNPCARLCRPLPHHSATPPLGLMPIAPSSG
jgi:hypothetical protein